MSVPSHPARQVRVGDVERDGAAQALAEHFSAGRLREDEFESRLAAAMSAQTYAELDALFLDLPPLYGPGAVTPAVPAAMPPAQRRPLRSPPPPAVAAFAVLTALAFVVEAWPLLVLMLPMLVIWLARRPAPPAR